MSAKPWFSTFSMAGPSGLGLFSDERPPHALGSDRASRRQDLMSQRITTPDRIADEGPTVVRYREELRAPFEQLNRDWIESYFVLEDADRAAFADPAGSILGPGGQIFFVMAGDTVLGTCAVLRHSRTECEIAKM